MPRDDFEQLVIERLHREYRVSPDRARRLITTYEMVIDVERPFDDVHAAAHNLLICEAQDRK